MRQFLFLLCAAVPLTSIQAGDWPTWRGTSRDDISSETGLLSEWPEGGPEKLWDTKEAGLGYSSFAIVGNQLFTMGSDGTENDSSDFLMALNVTDGSVSWKTRMGAYRDNGWGGGPRGTPSVSNDGKLVIGISAAGDLVCVRTANGEEVWRKQLAGEGSENAAGFGGSIPNWGYSESPLIDGDRLLCTPGGNAGTVVCLNLQTGETIWQSAELQDNAHYSSIIAVEHANARQYIQLTEKTLFGLSADGKLLWKTEFPGRTAVIPTPVYSEGVVFATAGYGAGCVCVRISDSNEVEPLYDTKDMSNHHGGVLLFEGHIYGHSDSKGLLCQKLETGEIVWTDNNRNRIK
ncbi:MAG: PQQ-binding-like beta-propeller repeat protein, partial [Planctomycetaceae bacterium]